MDYTTLGRTGLRVSVMGLGCGGHSRLGMARGASSAEAAAVVREALDLGVTFIDTAESYGTEEAVGLGLEGVPRESVAISTKAGVEWQGQLCSPADLEGRVDASLRRLRTDYVDVFHLHGVTADEYPYARDTLLPAMQAMQRKGKLRWPGITEGFIPDPQHAMMRQAVADDCWDVVMVGFNLLNQSARERVLQRTAERGVGTLCMFAVRRALSRPEALSKLVDSLVADGLVARGDLDSEDPLGFLAAPGVARTIPEAAYRFCRHEPGLDVILSGTGSVEHLRENAESINGLPLPAEVAARIRRVFARVDSVSGN